MPELVKPISSGSSDNDNDSSVGLVNDSDSPSSDDDSDSDDDAEIPEQKEADEHEHEEIAEEEHEHEDSSEYVNEQTDSSDGDDEHEDSDYVEEIAAHAVQVASRPRRSTTAQCPDYVGEQVDEHFNDGRPGYTHFGRTRKGGDTRPNGKEPEVPKAITSGVTIHNFFCASGKNCLRTLLVT